MLDLDGTANLWNWVDATYIQPEVQRRRQDSTWKEESKIHQFRILMPKNQDAIVQLNEEVTWQTKATRGDRRDFVPDTLIYLHELDRIESVYPPEVEGQQVAFIFFGWDGTQYQGCVDFTPNWPEEERVAQKIAQDDDWPVSAFLTQFLQSRLEERAAQICFAHRDLLKQFGLWLIPVLIPYPLAQIALYLVSNDEIAATNLLTSYCNSTFLENLISEWWRIDTFETRRELIQEALWAHRDGKYHLSVSTLLPHLEGIIADWEFGQGLRVQTGTQRRITEFQQQTQGEVKSPFLYTSVHSVTTEFILTGPVLETFRNWQDTLSPAFPNRHAIGHGRYIPSFFTEQASIKVFLLLDTIKQLIEAQQNRTNTT